MGFDLTLSDVAAMLQVAFGLIGLILGWLALNVARRSLIPLKPQIDRIVAEQKRRDELRKELVPPAQPRLILGFDPRFSNWDWNKLLAADGVPPPNLITRLSRTHLEFHGDPQRSIAGRSTESVLVVDLLHVPNLLKQGLIDPLTDHGQLNLDNMLGQRAELHGVKLEQPAVDMMRAMCSDQDGQLGALPLWINTHGRMIIGSPSLQGEARISQISSFDDLLDHRDADKLLTEAGVQSSYLIFEFWAHLAYRGCNLFEWSSSKQHFGSSLLSPTSAHRRALAEAVADLAVRLHFFRITGDMFRGASHADQFRTDNAFALEHAGDARMIRDGVALWKPVFSSELLWHTLPERGAMPGSSLDNEKEFLPPFVRHTGRNSWRYLTALGGYGLALPKGAASNDDSIRAMKYVFLRNPLLMHPYAIDILPTESDTITLEDFLGAYARPPLPFWPDIEKVLVDTLFDLLLKLPRQVHGHPRDVWTSYADVIERSDEVTTCLEALLQRLATIAAQSGWTFVSNRR